MANNQKNKGKGPAGDRAKPKPQRVYQKENKVTSLFESLNQWFDKRSNSITIFIFACGALFTILLFQARMDIGGDDSTYLQRAYDFVHKGIFPVFNGPLYPIVLSVFIAPFGLNIILLKILSCIFNLTGLYFFYRAFKDRIPSLIFYPLFFVTTINAYILNYASLTYSEAFFMCIQYIFLFYFFKLIDRLKENENSTFRDNYKQWLITGFLIFALALARSIGIISVGCVMLFFIINKQYRNALYSIGVFLVFEIPLWVIEKLFFRYEGQWGTQIGLMMQKDWYNKSKGYEDFGGFVKRFLQNCDIYLSKRFFEIIGFRSESAIRTYSPFQPDNLILFVIFIFLVLGFVLYRIIKSENKYMLFTFLFTVGVMVTSFFALQAQWDQLRIIIVCVPALLLVFFYGFYDLFNKKKSWGLQLILFITLSSTVLVGISNTLSKSSKNLSILSKTMHGDIYAGYTPDWVNYFKMSRWCADSLPKDAYVAARKSSMSFIYGKGKEFFPVYRVYSTNADSLLNYFKENKVNYIMLPSLRIDPERNTGDIITTMEYMVAPIYKKYPQKLKFVHQEGTDEPTRLFQIVNN